MKRKKTNKKINFVNDIPALRISSKLWRKNNSKQSVYVTNMLSKLFWLTSKKEL